MCCVELDVASKSSLDTYFSGDVHHRSNVEFTFGHVLELYDAIYAETEHWAKPLLDEIKFYLCQCPIASYDSTIDAKLPNLMNDITMYVVS